MTNVENGCEHTNSNNSEKPELDHAASPKFRKLTWGEVLLEYKNEEPMTWEEQMSELEKEEQTESV